MENETLINQPVPKSGLDVSALWVSARHYEGLPFRRVRHFQPFPAVITYG